MGDLECAVAQPAQRPDEGTRHEQHQPSASRVAAGITPASRIAAVRLAEAWVSTAEVTVAVA